MASNSQKVAICKDLNQYMGVASHRSFPGGIDVSCSRMSRSTYVKSCSTATTPPSRPSRFWKNFWKSQNFSKIFQHYHILFTFFFAKNSLSIDPHFFSWILIGCSLNCQRFGSWYPGYGYKFLLYFVSIASSTVWATVRRKGTQSSFFWVALPVGNEGINLYIPSFPTKGQLVFVFLEGIEIWNPPSDDGNVMMNYMIDPNKDMYSRLFFLGGERGLCSHWVIDQSQ